MNLNDEGDSVSLKEHLLAIVAAERERVDQHKAQIELRFELADRAVQLNHIEMLRRLDILNHAHERLVGRKRISLAVKCTRARRRNTANGETK